MSVKEKSKEPQPVNFWENGGYKADLDRINGDIEHAALFAKCIQERSVIEAEYAKKLTKWRDSYSAQFKKTSLYGTHQGACEQILETTQPVIRIHEHMSRALVNQCVTETNEWKKNTYKPKVFGGYKEFEDLEKDFAKAQKKWNKVNEKLAAQKKHYHKLVAQKATSDSAESEAKTADLKVSEEKYKNLLVEVEQMAPIYVAEMTRIHKRSQMYAQKKIEFLSSLFRDYVSITDLSKYDQKLAEQTRMGNDAINSINIAADLETWNVKVNFGKDLVLPDFEPEENKNSAVNANGNNNNGTIKSTKSIKIDDPGIEPVRKTSGTEVRRESFDGSSTQKVYALYDYEPKSGGELKLTAGMEFMKLSAADEQGWCEGVTASGEKGHFPSTYASPVLP
ncbi:Oidioi.mRNA.OKI2018_I69.XSR.g15022.t1.cds [Oikopleura dioica]|uniref:Oidioi.mRNA.OKI2018_I69.XSR.g15022.t1.cds n=1 Tax=Oikopleura dioica TaxID=34765 RepID=A0ABN7SBI5_OIKDI|nr:Oidioi.mRNA.OKI2018_I69.XSR.g15022.t1.cds [Oikopleura dioica]